jgi:glycosyltransferase involved in cell wall biosynthesis
MRITFILPVANMSGGFRVVVIYAQRLIEMGHTVHIVLPPPRAISTKQKLKSWLKGNGWPSDPLAQKSHLDGSGLTYNVLDRWRAVTDDDVPDADVVIATWWETAEWVNALSDRKGAKVYFIQHHEIFSHLPLPRCRATYRLPLHKIVVSRWLKDTMNSQYGDEVVDHVPNSVDRLQFYAPVRGKQTVPTAGFVYSKSPIVDIKGLDVTLAAFQIVRTHIPNLRIISFGSIQPGPLLEKVEFVLSPDQDKIRTLYAGCDVWIMASRSEGFGLPALEAMACRTPVVATRTGWPEEALRTGWNGVLVNVEDVDALAQGIEWVLSRSDKDWKSLSANACATADLGSWEESAIMFENALEHACTRSVRGEIAGKCLSATSRSQSL